MILTAENKCFEKLDEYEEKKLKRKHIKIIDKFIAKLRKDKKNRIKIIKNEAFELLSDLTMTKVDLKMK